MKKLLVTKAERIKIGEEAFIEMGKTIKYKVADLDKMVAMIRDNRKARNLSPYIDIIPAFPDSYKTPNKMPTFQKDPLTGVLYGIPNGEDDFGNIRWQRMQLSDNLSLNLDNEMECRMWAVLRFNPDIEGSPFQKQYPYYKIYDPVDQAKAEMAEVVEMKKAFELVEQIKKSPKELVFFARYLGEDLRENSNYNIVEGALLRHARHNPSDFISKFEDKNRSFAERFHAAISLGVIEQHPDKGFVYKSMPLGQSEEEAIKMLSMDNTLMTAINNLILEKDSVIRIIQAEFASKAMNQEKKSVKKNDTKEEKVVISNEDFD